MTLTPVLVLRVSAEYKPEHAVSLLQQLGQHWPADVPFRPVLMTDADSHSCHWIHEATHAETRGLSYPWSGWWSKMELFGPEQDDLDDVLYFDLDTVITGPLRDIVNCCMQAMSTPIMLRDFYRTTNLGSGLMYLPQLRRKEIWAYWYHHPADCMRRFRGDQNVLEKVWPNQEVAKWQDLLPNQVVSYKVHVRTRALEQVPADARVVCYHGKPRPWKTSLYPAHRAVV